MGNFPLNMNITIPSEKIKQSCYENMFKSCSLITPNFKNMDAAMRLPKRFPKWVTLSNDCLSLMKLSDNDVEELKGSKKGISDIKESDIGTIFSLGREPIDGIEFSNLYFKLYGIIKEYNGAILNSFVLKEVDIDENGNIIEGVNTIGRRKFSIPPSMCKMMGIKYEPGLELWPINNNFKIVNANGTEKIVYENMSTYPTSYIDGTIRKIVLELHGFSPYNNSHIITPSGALIPTNDFASSLTIFVKHNISTDNGCAGFKIGEELPFRIIVKNSDKKMPSICDYNHNICVEVCLTKKSFNIDTVDGLIGVSYNALEGKDVDDIIGVMWDESGDENAKKRSYEIASVNTDVDKVIEALDRHFSRLRY